MTIAAHSHRHECDRSPHVSAIQLGSPAVNSKVSVTRERHIPATPDAIWSVISTPEMHERLDSRCHLESATGDGGAGSEYVLVVRAGLIKTRLRYVVRESVPERRWIAEVDRGGSAAGVQHADLSRDEAGTLLRWNVTLSAGRLTRHLVTRSCERELERWLAAVDREALAHGG
jgi:carbon monoxide dehydrogenase subunit G